MAPNDGVDAYLTPENDRARRLARAKGYPYTIPEKSFVISDTGHVEIPDGSIAPIPRNRRAFIASGSNQSPEQLRRKFSGRGLGPIIVTRAQLVDHDVFYSAHITAYGSIPATIGPSPGSRVWINVSWLTPAQEYRMHETENVGVNYAFGKLSRIYLQIRNGIVQKEAMTYQSLRGLLLDDQHQPVALTEIACEYRSYGSMTQDQVLALVRDRVEPKSSVDDFIDRTILDDKLRAEHNRRLAAGARRFTCDGFAPVKPD